MVPERSDMKASFLPSGENCGPGPWSVWLVRGTRTRDSGLPCTGKSICQTVRLRVSRWYASQSPLRETAGCDPLSLNCTAASLASTETLQSAGFPPRSEEKIAELPSDDHRGDPRSLAASVVTTVGSPPAAGIVIICSGNPISLLRANRIFLPSEEKEGPQS